MKRRITKRERQIANHQQGLNGSAQIVSPELPRTEKEISEILYPY